MRLRWLLTALGLLGLAALCCAYLSLCLLFAQGGWQLLYQPSHAITATPATSGMGFTPTRFGVSETGSAEVTGWLLPSESSTAPTVLYLHDGAGSLGDAVPELAHLHSLGCSVFAIDYRGFGASAAAKPSERAMLEDAQKAVAYLEETRHISPSALVLWGTGTGATIAAEVSASNHELPVVLEQVRPPALERLRDDPRLRFLPVRLLLRDRLDAAAAVRESRVPKLFLTAPKNGASSETERLYAQAHGPKQLASTTDDLVQRNFLSSSHDPQR